MSDNPFIDPAFVRPTGLPNGFEAAAPTPATAPPTEPKQPEPTTPEEPAPLPDLVEEPTEELAAVPAADEPASDEVDIADEPVTDTPETDLSMQTIKDPESYVRNRQRFEEVGPPSPYLEDIFLIKVGGEIVRDALMELERRVGTEDFLEEVMKEGSSTNQLYRYVSDTYSESYRMLDILEKMTPEAREQLRQRFPDPNNPKADFRWYMSAERPTTGTEVVSGNAAYERMTAMDDGARGRFLLFESNIGLEMICPQNRDWDTLFNLIAQDEIAQYSDIGLEIYDLTTYRMREITLGWLRQFITKCSLFNWQKPNIFERAITLQDFHVLLVDLAQLSYPAGFDRFLDRCFRPVDETHPDGCSYSARLTIKPADLVVTRFALMTEEQFKEMANRRSLKSCTLAQVEDYRKGFGFASQTIEHRDWVLTLGIPTLDRHFTIGRAAFAASESVVAGGNTPSVLQDMANKGFRNLSCYIQSASRTKDGRSLTTTDPEAIMKILGKISSDDESLCDPDNLDEWVITKLGNFTESCQLSYIGYQTKPCPECGWINHATDGWTAIDPLRTFFTIGRSHQ